MTDKKVSFLPALKSDRYDPLVKAAIILLIVTAIFFVVFIVLGVITYYYESYAPIRTIDGQLEAINEGRTKQAFEKYSSAEFKKRTSLKDFTDLVNSNPQIFRSKETDFGDIEINDNRAVVKGTITGEDETVTPITYNLVFEKDEWRIVGFRQGIAEDN